MPRRHRRERIRRSSTLSMISVPPRLRATWFVQWEWLRDGWQPFSGGFGRGGVIGSVTDSALLPTSSSCNARLRTIMTKAVNELGLKWSPPEEPSRSRLDEWFLPGRHQAPHQRSSFFPEVHDELTKSWRATLSRICPSASTALTSVDGAEEKEYECLTPLDESVAMHLCSLTAIVWKARVSHPSKPCRATSALAGRAYSAAGQVALALHSMAVLPVSMDHVKR